MPVTHLLYLSQKPGQNPFSGAETPTLELVRLLAAGGERVELLVVEWNSGPLIENRLRDLAAAGVTVTRVVRRQRGRPRGRVARAVGCWLRLARELRRPRALVHLHLDLVVAPVLCRLGRVDRVVATVHNDDPRYATRTWRLWSLVLNRLVDRFVAISDHVAAYYPRAAGLRGGAIPVVRYPVADVEQDPALAASFRPPGARFVIGCIARLVPQKDPMLLAEVLRREPQWEGVLIGEGPERGRLERFVQRHALSNLHLLGAVPAARRLLRAFDVLVLPSRWEGLGLVLVEAMLAGIPIVASRAGAIPETLGHGRFGLLFEPGSIESLQQTLRRLYQGEVDVAVMTTAARAHAERRYAPEGVRDDMLALYRAVQGE